jgi:putative ATP-dependent endonuclease of OLD family
MDYSILLKRLRFLWKERCIVLVENVSIKNYRSIEELRLPRCGPLNVFIGQNNAGKSNILQAIHTVFRCIRGGRIVAPEVHVSNELNYFNKHTSSPVEISLRFSLALAERDSLLRDIATEAPHVKNALDGLDPSLRLAVTFTIVPAPAAFGIVSRISLAKVPDKNRIYPKD